MLGQECKYTATTTGLLNHFKTKYATLHFVENITQNSCSNRLLFTLWESYSTSIILLFHFNILSFYQKKKKKDLYGIEE